MAAPNAEVLAVLDRFMIEMADVRAAVESDPSSLDERFDKAAAFRRRLHRPAR